MFFEYPNDLILHFFPDINRIYKILTDYDCGSEGCGYIDEKIFFSTEEE